MKLLSLLALIGFVFVVGCESVEDEEHGNKILYTKKITSNKSLLFHMSNADIKWIGSKVGLQPKLIGTPAKLLIERGPSVTPFLLRGLEKEDKFVACHVLLTKLNLEGYFPIEGSIWNGLKVRHNKKGEPVYDKNEIPKLLIFWDRALKAKAKEKLERAGMTSD
jgi:hypothetical protein